MPSQLHEMLLLLFRNRPALAPELLREALHVELPAYSEVRLESADLTDVVPAEYRADLVVLLVDGKPVLGIVVEVQLAPDARKRFSWPVYVAGLRARLECPCCLLVVTASDKTAEWAQEPIALGPGSKLMPLVVGPRGVPVITDPERAKQDPELAVLSVMAHGRGDVETAVQIALSAAAGSVPLDEDRRVLYFDLIEAALSEAARKAFEMLPQNYEFQGPTYKKAKLEGQAVMAAASVLDVLEARGLSVSDEVRQRVQGSTDLEQLRRWIRRAAVITSADELFNE
ncbi:MAG TPA: hypothetical protein VI197_20510 [Polyangiaceae bacterium]